MLVLFAMSKRSRPARDIAKGLIVIGVSLEFMGTLLVAADWKEAGLVMAVAGFAAVIIGYLKWE